ncbi:vacuolar membrane-associated protein iml1, partial [Spiromyces aspiralis]
MRTHPRPVYNPCKPNLDELPRTALSQRWSHLIFSKSVHSSHSTKWVSMCTPAVMPLTTDYLPLEHLEKHFRKYSYTVGSEQRLSQAVAAFSRRRNAVGTSNEDPPQPQSQPQPQRQRFISPSSSSSAQLADKNQETMKKVLQYLLKELIYQRLSQGYQFVLLSNEEKFKLSQQFPALASTFIIRPPRYAGRDRSESMATTATAITPTTATTSTAYRPDAFGPSSMSPVGLKPEMRPTYSSTPNDRGELNAVSSGVEGGIPDNPTHIYLTNGLQIHYLSCSEFMQSGQVPTVSVERYERKIPYDASPINYKYMVWPRNGEDGYKASTIKFEYPDASEVNWNALDQQILGAQNELTDALKFWRTRYVLIPNETITGETGLNKPSNYQDLNDEETRIANFETFLSHVFSCLRLDERNRLEKLIPGHNNTAQKKRLSAKTRMTRGILAHFDILSRKSLKAADMLPSELFCLKYTTLFPIAYTQFQYYLYKESRGCALDDIIKDITPIDSVMKMDQKLTKDSPLELLHAILMHKDFGVSLTDIRWHCYLYRDSFFGHQLIRWLMVNFDTILNRSSAIDFGQYLLDKGLIEHAGRGLPFMDGQYVYRIVPLEIPRHLHLPSKEDLQAMAGKQQPKTQASASTPNIPRIAPASPLKRKSQSSS